LVPAGFRGLRELIADTISPQKLQESNIKLRVGTVDLESGSLWQATEPQRMSIPDPVEGGVFHDRWCGQFIREPDLDRDDETDLATRWIDIKDAVYASTIMPVYFPPIMAYEQRLADGSIYIGCELPTDFQEFLRQVEAPVPVAAHSVWRHFFDGGLADVVPVRTAMRMGCREITVIGVSPLQLSKWNYGDANGVDAVTTPAFQYFLGFLDTWGKNVAGSDMMLSIAANEFLGWLYRLQAVMPREVAAEVRSEFEAYARERRVALARLLGAVSWMGGSVPMDPAMPGLAINGPFYDEACEIKVVAPENPLELKSTEFTNAERIREARTIGFQQMGRILERASDITVSFPVPESRILTAAQANALGIGQNVPFVPDFGY
jgi:hypothetical protein